MRIIIAFILGMIGFGSIILGISLSTGNHVFADITFDTESETQWYRWTNPDAVVSAMPEPSPLPVNITIAIIPTTHSH